MTIEEIQAELLKLRDAMSSSGIKLPTAALWVRADERFIIHLGGCDIPGIAGGKFIYADTPAKGIAEAWAFIKALADPEQTILTTYSRKLADAIDYGHENNVPAKLVDPVRRAQKAVSDALLPAPSAA